jgi:hypothetical protein
LVRNESLFVLYLEVIGAIADGNTKQVSPDLVAFQSAQHVRSYDVGCVLVWMASQYRPQTSRIAS